MHARAGRRALVLLSRFNLRINGKLAKALPFLVEVSSWARGIFKVEKVPRRFLHEHPNPHQVGHDESE